MLKLFFVLSCAVLVSAHLPSGHPPEHEHDHNHDHDHDHDHDHGDDRGYYHEKEEVVVQVPTLDSLEDMEALTFFALLRKYFAANVLAHKFGHNHEFHPVDRLVKESFSSDTLSKLIKNLSSKNFAWRAEDDAVNCSTLVDHYIGLFTRSPSALRKNKLDELCSVSSQCLGPKSLSNMFKSASNTPLADGVARLCPMLLLQNDKTCSPPDHDHDADSPETKSKPSNAAIWGYGLLFMTINCCAALVGVALLPCLNKKLFNNVLQVCMGLAVGSLVAASFFHLMPQALDVDSPSFQWKALTIFAGVYVFYWVDRGSKLFQCYKKFSRKNDEVEAVPPGQEITLNSVNGTEPPTPEHGHSHGALSANRKPGGKVASVAWMLLVGDSLNNFIDGVAVGAAFTESILAGVSISVAVLCEELPREIGDFAVYLAAGMSVKQALCYNFASQALCYLGLCVGIALGGSEGVGDYILAFSAGTSLYISLISLMTEMNISVENAQKVSFRKAATILLLQNAGLLVGVLILFLFALFGDKISFEGETHMPSH